MSSFVLYCTTMCIEYEWTSKSVAVAVLTVKTVCVCAVQRITASDMVVGRLGCHFLLIASQLNLSSSSSSADRSTKEWMTILLLTTRNGEKINAPWRKRDSLVVRHLILSKMPNRDENKKERRRKEHLEQKKKKKEYSSQSFFDTDDYIQAHAAHATGQNRAWIESAYKREEGWH